MLSGSVAPSFARLSANSQPFSREQILAFVGELVDPPAPTPRASLLVEPPAA